MVIDFNVLILGDSENVTKKQKQDLQKEYWGHYVKASEDKICSKNWILHFS